MDEMQLLRELGDATPLVSATDLAPARARLTAATRPHPRRRAVDGVRRFGRRGSLRLFSVWSPWFRPVLADLRRPVPIRFSSWPRPPRSTPRLWTPRADQFVYLKAKEPDGTIREDWLSVDGTHDSIVYNNIPVPGCRDGKQQIVPDGKPIPGVTEPCEPNPAYRPDLPPTRTA